MTNQKPVLFFIDNEGDVRFSDNHQYANNSIIPFSYSVIYTETLLNETQETIDAPDVESVFSEEEILKLKGFYQDLKQILDGGDTFVFKRTSFENESVGKLLVAPSSDKGKAIYKQLKEFNEANPISSATIMKKLKKEGVL